MLLSEATNHIGRTVSVKCIVSGKDLTSFLVPKKVSVCCSASRTECDGCAFKEKHNIPHSYTFPRDNHPDDIVHLLLTSQTKWVNAVRRLLGVREDCACHVEILEHQQIEHLILSSEAGEVSNYVSQSGFYIGSGIAPNTMYDMQLVAIPHPRTNAATNVVFSAKAAQDELSMFHLITEDAERIRECRPRIQSLDALKAWVDGYYSQLSAVTGIIGRLDLHIGVDLAFHSPNEFQLGTEYIRKGTADILLLGDTKTGKGYTTEGLVRFYRLGHVANGENSTFAGLIGGLEKIGNYFHIQWGCLPLNNNRLVVIDEAGEVAINNLMRKLSRIRSEGTIEMSRIGRNARADAKARLIWLANPSSGKPLGDFTFPITALKELIKMQEDISRFDYVIFTGEHDVPTDIINVSSPRQSHLAQDIERLVVLWSWTRRKDHIIFSRDAITEIYAVTKRLSEKFHSSIPLLMGASARTKIAKIAASIAMKTFATSDNVNVQVEKFHVLFVEEFLQMIYCKDSCKFDKYSIDCTYKRKRNLDSIEGVNS